MSKPAGAVHYERDATHTLCGREITATTRLAGWASKVTCIKCKYSPALDGALGNMTHPGH